MQCVSVSSEISACDGRVRKDLSGAVCHVTSAELHTDLDKVEGWISGMVRTRNIYSLASKGWTTSPCLQRCLVVRSAGRRNNRSIKRCKMKLRPCWTHWELCHMCYTWLFLENRLLLSLWGWAPQLHTKQKLTWARVLFFFLSVCTPLTHTCAVLHRNMV